MTQPDPATRAERRKALTKMYEDWMADEAASPAALDVMRLPVPAIRRAVEWVEQNIAPKRCDNEGVSDCWRCTTVALARWWSDLLAQEETRA